MHIVFVTHAFPRWDGDVAGTFIERLAQALVALGHRLTVMTPSDKGRGGPERRSGVDVQWVRYAPAERETLALRLATLLAGPASRLTATAVLARGHLSPDRGRVRAWVFGLFEQAVADLGSGKVSAVVVLTLQAPYRL